ncbi:MAG: CsbD family protein [Methylovirgula sp.]
MNWDRIEGNWKQFKGKIREKWGDLSDSDLEKINGRRDQFEGVLQERYGIGRDVAQKNVDEWLKTLH